MFLSLLEQDVFGDVIWQILIDTYLILWWEKPVKATHKSTVTLVLALNATRSCWERVVTRPTLPIVYQVEKLVVIMQTVAHLSCPVPAVHNTSYIPSVGQSHLEHTVSYSLDSYLS